MKRSILLAVVWAVMYMYSCSGRTNLTDGPDNDFSLSDTMIKSLQVAEVELSPLKNEFQFYGKITVDNNKLIEVFPLVGGNVVKVFVELGDYVSKGQVLASIRSSEVAGFEKELMDAKSDVIITRNNLKVAHELFEGKLNSERDVLEAQSQLDKAQSQLSRVKEIFDIYNLKSGSKYEVTAPISGFIIQKNINQDMQLRSDRTDNIFDISQIDEVWAIANVPESEIGSIKLGVDAFVKTLSYRDTSFVGKVDKIFNIIDPNTKSMKIRVKLENKGYLLKPEMRASILLRSEEDRSALSIPSEAVIFDKNKYYVIILSEEQNVTARQIEIYSAPHFLDR